MRRQNPDKVRAKTYAVNEVNGLISRLMNTSNDIREWESEATFVLAGTPSGEGEKIIECGGRSREALLRAIATLERCKGILSDLDVYEEVADDKYW